MTSSTPVTVQRDDGWIEIRPQDWEPVSSPASHQGLAVLGGTILHRADAGTSDQPRALILRLEPAQEWLGPLYGQAVADAAAATFEDGVLRTVLAVPTLPEMAEHLRLLTRALWYGRWWPSGDRADPELRPTLEEGLLDLDVGTLAWEAALFFEDDALATMLLGRSRATLLSTLARARGLTGRRREYADRRLATAVDAALDLASTEDSDELLDVLAQVRDEAARTEALVAEALANWDAGVPMPEDELATTASAPGTPTSAVRYTTTDWAYVPPRSVSSAEHNVSLTVTPRERGALVDVEVEAGDHPVAALAAWLHHRESGTVLARFAVAAEGARYHGTVTSPLVTSAGIDELDVHIAAIDAEPAPGTQPSWLASEQPQEAADLRRYVRGLVVTQRARANDVGHPLLCEIVDW